MKTLFILSASLLLLCIIALGIFVIISKLQEFELNKITLIVSILGILISACFSIYSIPSVIEAPNEVLSNNESSQGDKTETNNCYESITDETTEENNPSYTESVNENENNTQGTTDNTDELPNNTTESSSEQENIAKIVPLYEAKTYLQEGSITREEITSDPRGNTYNNAYVFWAEYFTLNTGGGYYDKPYLEKYLGGKYSNLSLNITPYKDFDKYNKNVEAYIKIYADEKLIHTSASITRKTDCDEVNLSIEDVNYLRIELNAGTELTNYYNQYSVIIYDAKLITE